MIREMDTNIQDWYSIENSETGRFSLSTYTCLVCGDIVKYGKLSKHVETHGLILNHEIRTIDCRIRYIG